MMRQKRYSSFICLLVACCCAGAQNFTEKANLQTITGSGFYSIPVTPELSSYATVNYSDLRIADDKNRFVPYIIISNRPSFITHNYSRLPIIKNELTDSGHSRLIIKNGRHEKISSLALLIRNAAVNRYATISGSDDQHNWFSILENINLEDRGGLDTDKYVQTINFPPSSYRFFKIIINNRNNNPLNIIEAGRYIDSEYRMENNYVVNPSPVFVQKDSSDNNTYINVHQNAAYHIEKISLQIESQGFFERDAEIINRSGIASFKIRTGNIPGLKLPAFNDTNWSIKIYNGDNPPLKINFISLQQQPRNIVAYLQAAKNYHLLMHDSTATKPVYDLQKFEDSIPSNPPQLDIVSFETIKPASAVISKMTLSSTWLWTLIIVVLITLGFVTYRLTKEMSKK